MCEGSKERRLLRRKKQVEGREMRRKNLRHVSIPTPVIVEGTATPTAPATLAVSLLCEGALHQAPSSD